jgi:serine/threonine protein kinase
MVMEYMEGETLAARIAKGAVLVDQAVKFAIQIADALDRAHRAGNSESTLGRMPVDGGPELHQGTGL